MTDKLKSQLEKYSDEMAHKFVHDCPKYSGYPEHIKTYLAGFSACEDLLLPALDALDKISGRHHADTCSFELTGEHPCDCHVSIARAALSRLEKLGESDDCL
jgi:hypothetical protein